MEIAVIGSGISGLSAAWLLNKEHEVTLFEASAFAGGHTNSVDVTLDGATYPVDTGFLVYNDLTYPNLIQLFKLLSIKTHETEMSFSVNLPEHNIEWAGSSLSTVFAQKQNLLRPRFLLMLREILSFNSSAQQFLDWSLDHRATLGELLDEHHYSASFREWYLLPMAAAIWSSSPADILHFPASTFLRFCINHRLLQIKGRPQWRSILGGARTYVDKMTASMDVKLNHPVESVTRDDEGILLVSGGQQQRFDAVIFASHAPDTLAILKDADNLERNILGAVKYQPNRAILHTDRSFLPQRESLWSAWNYTSTRNDNEAVCVTYLLNSLQRLPFETPLMVTLNPAADPDPEKVIRSFTYEHPILDQPAIDAQEGLESIQGHNKAWFCGAWSGYGFHEDGLKSALRIINDFGVDAPWRAVL